MVQHGMAGLARTRTGVIMQLLCYVYFLLACLHTVQQAHPMTMMMREGIAMYDGSQCPPGFVLGRKEPEGME